MGGGVVFISRFNLLYRPPDSHLNYLRPYCLTTAYLRTGQSGILQAGTWQVAAGTRQVAAGTRQVAAGTQQVAAGTRQVAAGT